MQNTYLSVPRWQEIFRSLVANRNIRFYLNGFFIPTILICLLNIIFASCSYAATFEVSKLKKGGHAIFIDGELEFGDEKKFARIVVEIDEAIVVFKSPGGNVKAGMEIGRAIRIKGFTTYVADNEYCASACAIAWLGGQTRLMSTSAKIGFHGAYLEQNGQKITTSAGNALVGAYLSQLGLPENAIIYITLAKPESMTWLSFSDAQKVGITVEPFNIGSYQNQSTSQAPATAPKAQPNSTNIEQRAVVAYEAVQSLWSEPNNTALPKLASLYDERITYYGKLLDSNVVIKEKYDFANRWPDRVYFAEPGTLRASCNTSGLCWVTGIVNWRAHSPSRGTTSTGTAELELGFDMSGQKIKIFRESGKVLTRQVTR
jgi:hypothetical protein